MRAYIFALLLSMAASCAATPTLAQHVAISPAPSWRACAAEGATCASLAGALIRYGAGTNYTHRVVNGAVACSNQTFGDPAPNLLKTCAIASPAATTGAPMPTPTAAPVPAPAPVTDPRAKLGVNVASVTYFSNEPTFANQAYGLVWLENWQDVPSARLRPDGMPLSVEKGKALQGFLMPPATVYTNGDTTTVCTWTGTGELYAAGDWSWPTAQGRGMMEFKWNHGKPPRVWLEIRESSAADPIRDLDCRLKSTNKGAVYDPALLAYLEPFGVLRFLDWSRANSSPAVVNWAGRSKPDGIGKVGNDGVALEHMIGLANANGSSPWFTVPWNADADYHRRMAQLVHDTVPAGRPVYVELSNEVWNYGFWQTQQAQQEGLAAKLADAPFQAMLNRYAQKLTEVMPIWAEVFKDRPTDLVRVAATQADNVWLGEQIVGWNNGAALRHFDAFAIAPYFSVGPENLGANHDANMAALQAQAKRQIAEKSAAYKALADKSGKRLIAYEGGQHQLDPGRLDRMQAMNRDPRMEGIYRQYLTDWNALTGDLFTLYSATGAISQYGAWGLREYAGQPVAETPKLRGVIGK